MVGSRYYKELDRNLRFHHPTGSPLAGSAPEISRGTPPVFRLTTKIANGG